MVTDQDVAALLSPDPRLAFPAPAVAESVARFMGAGDESDRAATVNA